MKTSTMYPQEVIIDSGVITSCEAIMLSTYEHIPFVLEGLRAGLKRRDVFVEKSLCFTDPRASLLAGPEWKTTKPIICRTLERRIAIACVVATTLFKSNTTR